MNIVFLRAIERAFCSSMDKYLIIKDKDLEKSIVKICNRKTHITLKSFTNEGMRCEIESGKHRFLLKVVKSKNSNLMLEWDMSYFFKGNEIITTHTEEVKRARFRDIKSALKMDLHDLWMYAQASLTVPNAEELDISFLKPPRINK